LSFLSDGFPLEIHFAGGMVGTEALSNVKEGCVLINVGRGAVVDEQVKNSNKEVRPKVVKNGQLIECFWQQRSETLGISVMMLLKPSRHPY